MSEIFIDVDGTCQDCLALPTETLVKIAVALGIRGYGCRGRNKERLCVDIAEHIGCMKEAQMTVMTVGGAQAGKVNRQAYKKLLKWLFRGFKVALGTVGTVVSFGAAGDTIPDVLFTVADAAILANNIRNVVQLSSDEQFAKPYVDAIYNLQWTGNPEDVKTQMQELFATIDAEGGEASTKVYQVVCEKYLSVLDSFAALFGSLVSTMIPDDAGAARLVIETALTEGVGAAGKKPFETMTGVYNRIPENAREILRTPENLRAFLDAVVAYLRDLLPQPDEKFWKRAWKHVKRGGLQHLILPLIPGGMAVMPIVSVANVAVEHQAVAKEVNQWITDRIVPNLDTYVALMMRVLPMAFGVTLVLQKCSE